MRNIAAAIFCCLLAWRPSPGQGPRRPKLVVVIAVDQFRYDYLTRFRADYTGGLATLLRNGAVFTNARYDHFPTVTAVGHSILTTGARPSVSGIVGNNWYSRAEGRLVTSVCDDTVQTIGRIAESAQAQSHDDCTDASPASPRRLLVDTVGDELRTANEQSKVIGISLKPRSAILPAGHMANGAFWFDESGVFVSSSYYGSALPRWASDFNKETPAAQYAGKEWMGIKFGSGADLYREIPASPWGNELIENFAEAAIDGEHLGSRGVTDMLTISFSSNDYVGHRVGPDDPAVRDMAIRTDKLLDRLFHFLDARHLGPNDVVEVLSADHGVAPLPELEAKRGMPGGRVKFGDLITTVQQALSERFGAGDWIVKKPLEYVIYLNLNLIKDKKLDRADVDRVAADALGAHDHVFRVYTREQLEAGVRTDRIAQAMTNGFFSNRSGDLTVLLDPYWMFSSSGTTHGTPYNYDAHVPLIFMGSGIRPGHYHANVSITDVAPTISSLLGIEMPAGADGRVLTEAFSDN